MGGRGASFSKNFGEGIKNLSGNGVLVFVNDEPIPEDKMTDTMKKLKEHNIITYKSILNLPEDIRATQLDCLAKLANQNKGKMRLIENVPMQVQLARFSNTSTQACFQRNIDFSKIQILYNANYARKSLKQIEETTKQSQESGWWSKCDEANFSKYVTTHEFGHFMQFNAVKKIIDRRYNKNYADLLENYQNNRTKENANKIEVLYEKIANQINNKIALISKKEYGTMNIDDISRYGRTNQAEAFAELFANMTLSSKPVDMAKAMQLYLGGKKK